RTTVDHVDSFWAEAHRDPGGIHRRVAGAEHSDTLTDLHRRIVLGKLVRLHQVDAREKLVGRVNSGEVFARQIQKVWQAGAGPQEDGIVSLVEEFVDGLSFTDHTARHEFDADVFEFANLGRDDTLGQRNSGMP